MKHHWRRAGLIALWLIGASSWALADAVDDYFRAIKADDTRTVTTLLFQGLSPNTLDPAGMHGLVLAAREGSLKVADLLLSLNATKIEVRTPQDENALMMAALGGHEALVKTLIGKGADVNKTGWAPLHYAATKGHVNVIRILLEHHAYIDAESPNKSTPLMMAAMYGSPEAVKLLVDEGADVNLKNDKQMTAYDFAVQANRTDSAKLIDVAVQAKRPKGSW